MATHARPVPLDPYHPVASTRYSDKNTNEAEIYPSPFIPIRLPVFAPVLWLNDRIIELLNIVAGGSTGAQIRKERMRSPELDRTESGAQGVEMNALPQAGRRAFAGQRVNIGRRKFE